jgi:hypothetical protein
MAITRISSFTYALVPTTTRPSLCFCPRITADACATGCAARQRAARWWLPAGGCGPCWQQWNHGRPAWSPWNGRRLWVGTQLPSGAQAGDLWLDACQLTPMLLVPHAELWCGEDIPPRPLERMPSFIGWIDTRHSNCSRLLRGADEASVTDLPPDEAWPCANWFGRVEVEVDLARVDGYRVTVVRRAPTPAALTVTCPTRGGSLRRRRPGLPQRSAGRVDDGRGAMGSCLSCGSSGPGRDR